MRGLAQMNVLCEARNRLIHFTASLSGGSSTIGRKMKRIKLASVEEKCPACNGTGVEPVKQPRPGRRIYAPRCTECGGKGRITKAANKGEGQP